MPQDHSAFNAFQSKLGHIAAATVAGFYHLAVPTTSTRARARSTRPEPTPTHIRPKQPNILIHTVFKVVNKASAMQPFGQQTCTGHVHSSRPGCSCLPIQRCSRVRVRASTRESKDPGKLKSMDEAREYLMQQEAGPSLIAGALNWLSNSAFGFGQAGANVGSWYRQWLTQSSASLHRAKSPAAAAALPTAAPDALRNLSLVMLVSEHRVQKLATTYPQVLTTPPAEVAARLLLLKDLLPDADVARMVELAPGLLLGASEADLIQAQQRVSVLAQHLPGADVTFMVQEDPSLMFEDLEPSLPRMYELWPDLDASTLAASDPKHLALALRALSDQGPPRRF